MKILILTGTTGTGKTKLSIQIAKRYNCEIINIDSTQFYKQLNVGTNKISHEEMQNVKHHMLSFLNVDENYSIYDYKKTVVELIEQIRSKKKNILIVGASGLYISSLVNQYFFTTERNKDFEQLYSFSSNKELHKALTNIDVEESKKIHPNNRIRLLRALEIYYNTGKTKTQLINEQKTKKNVGNYTYYIIELVNNDKRNYLNNIQKRIEFELNNGFIQETKKIIKTYPNFKIYYSANIMGYVDVINYINDKITLSDLEKILFNKTKHLIKKQKTFIKNKLTIDYEFDVNLKKAILYNNIENNLNWKH